MKLFALTVASVGVAALPQLPAVPSNLCGTRTLSCCRLATGSFLQCDSMPLTMNDLADVMRACAPSKFPACCDLSSMNNNPFSGILGNLFGSSLPASNCAMLPSTPSSAPASPTRTAKPSTTRTFIPSPTSRQL
ncbi:uncharacterized protein MAM_04521 [Metarhizium album ARSEF 1941]|uniref:Hydrophobin n=1 Tax=Metarhizium album (strain ARSEF 1941) TaxID=1081103 RepID=A0A0B2WN65_METAS|nr:uncharacterized protein MAM_04521 [Metarhizium album ARSEF 1941]KHN97506.1 hypothetical protein MAM_04521 [Metarhizium album ARSEF 1941]